MNDAAVRWAESQLGATIAAVTALTGGTTSTMLRLRDTAGHDSVLRLMTNEPWRTHGAELTARERDAQRELASTAVPAPTSLALDADGAAAGVAAHLMSRVPGVPGTDIDESMLTAMARMLATIHAVSLREPFRTFQSWAWEAKRVVPAWSNHPDSWRHAFEILAGAAPSYVPTFLHRDFSHRNLLWTGDAITGVVDWVESSTGP
ncbi:MAG TPA: aminoglycoside phosphotransferase family protein, partial [Nocardioides sp.]